MGSTSKRELLSVLLAPRGARTVVYVPAASAAIAFILSLLLAPSIGHENHGSFTSLFGATGEIIATLLVALALEARALPRELGIARHLVVIITLTYVALGVAASVVALVPSLPGRVHELLFALAMSGGAGALTSVLAIGYRIVEADYERRRRAAIQPTTTRDEAERSLDEE